jgi:hypothetical protein
MFKDLTVQGVNPWDYDLDQSEHSSFAVCHTKTLPLPCVVSWYTAKKTAVHQIFAVCWFLPLPCVDCLPCADFYHCRAAFFVVRLIESLPCVVSLPCIFLTVHGKDFFAVRRRMAKKGCTAVPIFPVVCEYLLS